MVRDIIEQAGLSSKEAKTMSNNSPKEAPAHKYVELTDAKDQCRVCGEVFSAHEEAPDYSWIYEILTDFRINLEHKKPAETYLETAQAISQHIAEQVEAELRGLMGGMTAPEGGDMRDKYWKGYDKGWHDASNQYTSRIMRRLYKTDELAKLRREV